MYQSGALYHLLPLLFGYDYTLNEGGVERSEDSNQQEQNNRLAEAALRACAALAGYRLPLDAQTLAAPAVAVAVDSEPGHAQANAATAAEPVSDGCPDNPSVQQSLRTLLTPFVCRRLQDQSPAWLLKLLTSNCQTPYLIWDNATRAELLGYLEDQQLSLIRTVGFMLLNAPQKLSSVYM